MSRIVGIVSGKGGVGKTTFSTNLALALSKLNKRVLLVDCNVTTPHMAYYLGSNYYTSTINDVLKGSIDIRHAPTPFNNLLFIPASENIEDLINMDIAKLDKHISKLLKDDHYDFVLLDSAPGLGKEAVSVLKASKEIIFVTTPTIPTLADVTKCAQVASNIGINKFNVVLNMVKSSRFELNSKQVKEMINFPLLGMISFDRRIVDSTAKGMPVLLERSSPHIENTYMEIAAELSGEEYKSPHVFYRIKNKLKRLGSKMAFSR